MDMPRSLNMRWRREKVLVGLSMGVRPCMMMSCFSNAKGEEMFVSLLVCCQGLRAGVPIATL